ncbi:MAG TPA: ABC transporter substrate-binding protein [Propionicimonas sp.]|uniref:ABC transporter substrate-binding protein n=1 Tax=Propionicimonas sp. TaxID=1955623 RepID=UPI002F40BD5D
MKRIPFVVAAGAVAISLVLTACTTAPPTPTASSTTTSAPKASTLRVWAGSSTPITVDFNPFHVDTALFGTYGPIYEPLFFYNQLSADPPTPMLGESFTYSADGRSVTIKLKPNVKWSDGEPLTADDVVFTLGYGPNKSDKMVSATATDATTVDVKYSTPQFTNESQLLGATMIVPRHVWSKVSNYMKETNAKPVGSGAYVVKTTSDASYTFTANPNYRDGAPPISDVQYLGLDSNQSGQDMLTTGQIDWTGMFVANPDTVTGDGAIATMNQQQDPTVIVTCSDAAKGCKGAQTDPAVRQALNVAIDRPALAEKAWAGLVGEANPAFVLLPRDQQWLGDPSLAPSPQSPNAAQAGQILEAAGYAKNAKGFYAKDGKEVDLDLFSPDGWTDYNDAAKLIAEEAGKAGIKVTARTVSEAEYWTPVTNGDFQLAMYGLTQSLVADPFSNYDQYFYGKSTAKVGDAPTRGQNYSRYANPVVDAAVEAAGATNDPAAKKAEYAKIQAQISKDLPYIPVVLNASQAFFNTKGFTGWPTDDNLYADPLPYLSVAPAIVLLHLKPVS